MPKRIAVATVNNICPSYVRTPLVDDQGEYQEKLWNQPESRY